MRIKSSLDREYNIEINGSVNSNSENYCICPICTPNRQSKHQHEKKLAVNFGYKPRIWRCGHCGEGGIILDDIIVSEAQIKPLVSYRQGNELSDGFIKWLSQERKISLKTAQQLKYSLSDETLMQSKVSESNKQLIGKFATRKCLNFPYFYKDQLINIKFRDQDKNFKLLKGASIVMYNIDAIKGFDWCIIVEGEFDVAAYYEAGIATVTSVPNGAQISDKERKIIEKTGKVPETSSMNLEYLDLVIDEFEDKKIIYIATDDDPPGIKLREELSRRLGKDRCKFIRFKKWECKDANDVLKKHGKEALADTINHAETYPIEGVSSVQDHWSENKKEYEEGRKRSVPIGYKSLLPHLGWMPGWLYVVNGHPSMGKTSFMLNLAVISSILQGYKWGLYMPENYPPKNIIDTMAEILVGKTSSIEWVNRMSMDEYYNACINHLNKHMFFVDNERGFTPEELRVIKKQMIRQYGIHGFITDPWKNLVHSMGKLNIDDYIREQLNQEVRLTTHERLINMICHHPKTPVLDKEKRPKCPSPFDLTGGAVWYQTAYVIFTINRQDPFTKGNDIVEIHVNKIKEKKLMGETTEAFGPILFRYEHKSSRFLERDKPDNIDSTMNTYPLNKSNIVIQSNLEGF